MIWPFLIPLSAIICGIGAGVAAMFLANRDKERRHKERLFLMERGLEVPKELYDSDETQKKRPITYRAGRAWLMILGATCVFVGLGVMIGVSLASGWDDGVHGVIPLLIGVGFLVAERMITRFIVEPAQREQQE